MAKLAGHKYEMQSDTYLIFSKIDKYTFNECMSFYVRDLKKNYNCITENNMVFKISILILLVLLFNHTRKLKERKSYIEILSESIIL